MPRQGGWDPHPLRLGSFNSGPSQPEKSEDVAFETLRALHRAASRAGCDCKYLSCCKRDVGSGFTSKLTLFLRRETFWLKAPFACWSRSRFQARGLLALSGGGSWTVGLSLYPATVVLLRTVSQTTDRVEDYVGAVDPSQHGLHDSTLL